MLIVVLVLVIVALALLVTSLVLGQTLLAWLSIAASVLAAILLIVDVMRRRRSAAGEDPAGADDPAETPVDDETPDAESADDQDQDRFDDVEPGEEETEAADLLAVSELHDQVVVLDERPRYHLENCSWVGSRETIPLPLREARDLGFTPCGVCTPDRVLAARSRAAKRGRTTG